MPLSILELSMTFRSLSPALAFLLTAPALMAQSTPAPMKADIVETATAAGSFNTLLAALNAAGLADTLKGTGPFTVFAPTDEAFAKLPAGTVEALLKDIPKLRSILTYHVVAGQVLAKDVVKLASAKTLQGQSLAIHTQGGVQVDGARVVQADVMASNGVIHVIDSVVLPRS
jgi:uncharacterized surface protein with fasciclin (FAS1) repeats